MDGNDGPKYAIKETRPFNREERNNSTCDASSRPITKASDNQRNYGYKVNCIRNYAMQYIDVEIRYCGEGYEWCTFHANVKRGHGVIDGTNINGKKRDATVEETITRPDPLSMIDIIWWILSIGFVDSLTMDYSLECEAGYRVSSIHRLTSLYEKSGALMIFCDLIEADASKVNCERLQSVPQCSGTPEGCTGESWLAGFHAYIIENTTEATLLDPVCCRSANIRVDESSCIHDRLNKVQQSFQHGVASDLLYRGLQCWHQYNGDNTLVDLIWKMEICAFTSTLGSPPLTTKCRRDCDCFCGIEQCADGRYPIKIIHRRQQRQNSCECHCNCAYECL